eukprot:gene32277-41831_t
MDAALQSSVFISSPEFAGWLNKRGFHWRKLWKRRWVALHGAEIAYMDKEPTSETASSLNITKAQISTASVIDRDDIDGNPNGFAIHINDGHSPTWYLRADNSREKKSWLMRLAHLEEFEKVRVLGVGGTGIVYELLHKSNGKRYAMKEMEIKSKQQMQMAVSEAEMLKDITEAIRAYRKQRSLYGARCGDNLPGHHQRPACPARERHPTPGHQIMITDFGLAKLFKNVQDGHIGSGGVSGPQEASAQPAFSEEVMKTKLKAFTDTGELNRDGLRGTGYMSPELILMGYTSKATDVFAAGVVLYILLCGLPPFHSKSNREVLEKTAKGQYSMAGKAAKR